MVDPFDEVSFLTRSENRVEVLSALSDGSYTERELVEKTGISDVTVGRILEDFINRGWVVRTDGNFRATRIGRLVADDYERLSATVDIAARLGPVQDLLPVETFDFDLRLLAEARVTDPESFDALRTVDRWLSLIRQSNHIRVVAPPGNATEVVTETVLTQVTDHDMRFEAVLAADYFEPPAGRPDLRSAHAEMIHNGAELYQLDDDTDFTASYATYDELAAIAGFDETGSMRVGVETRAEPVYEWIVDTFESYRADATRLVPADLSE